MLIVFIFKNKYIYRLLNTFIFSVSVYLLIVFFFKLHFISGLVLPFIFSFYFFPLIFYYPSPWVTALSLVELFNTAGKHEFVMASLSAFFS